MRWRVVALIAASVLVAIGCSGRQAGAPSATEEELATVALPSPMTEGEMSLEAALARRRSVRAFSAESLSQAVVGQLLWAAQGVTDAEGRRTAPSAGALYPLEVYAATDDGVFRYVPAEHALKRISGADPREGLQDAALGQPVVGEAPLVLVITGVIARTEARYGADRAARYVQLEAGHVAQNVLLEAVALGLGAVPVGAFDDAAVGRVMGLPSGEAPLYLLAIGHPE